VRISGSSNRPNITIMLGPTSSANSRRRIEPS
jgi:hypothetical protein